MNDPYRSPAVVIPQPDIVPSPKKDEFDLWVPTLEKTSNDYYLLSVDVTRALRALFEENKALKKRVEFLESCTAVEGTRHGPPLR